MNFPNCPTLLHTLYHTLETTLPLTEMITVTKDVNRSVENQLRQRAYIQTIVIIIHKYQLQQIFTH